MAIIANREMQIGELLKRVRACKCAAELRDLAREDGYAGEPEGAAAYLGRRIEAAPGDIRDEELDGADDDPRMRYGVGTFILPHNGCREWRCKACGLAALPCADGLVACGSARCDCASSADARVKCENCKNFYPDPSQNYCMAAMTPEW